jgi:hypothetical protein
MSYRDEIEVWLNDYGYDINFQCTDESGAAFNLTGYTVNIRVALPNASACKFIKTAVVTDAANGLAKYSTVQGDFDTVGTYEVALIGTKTGSEITFGNLRIIVQAKPPSS